MLRPSDDRFHSSAPFADTAPEHPGMTTSQVQWIQPAAFIAGAVAIFGWFVAYSLRSHESQRENRRATYAKVLGPTAECLSSLRQARDEDRHTWVTDRRSGFDESLVRLIAAVGEVDLIRKSKVSWTALQLWRTLSDARALTDIKHIDKQEDVELFRHDANGFYERGQQAREDFLLMAGRSLEAWPVRRWRDMRSTPRKLDVERIRSSARATERTERRHSSDG
jgi:hypothetical protein